MARKSIVSVGLICLVAFAFVPVKVQCGDDPQQLTTGFIVREKTLLYIADGSFFTFTGFGDGAAFASDATPTINRGFGALFPVLTGLGVMLLMHFWTSCMDPQTHWIRIMGALSCSMCCKGSTLSVGLVDSTSRKLYFQAGPENCSCSPMKSVVPCQIKHDPGKAEVQAL